MGSLLSTTLFHSPKNYEYIELSITCLENVTAFRFCYSYRQYVYSEHRIVHCQVSTVMRAADLDKTHVLYFFDMVGQGQRRNAVSTLR